MAPMREPAIRAFARELNAATQTFSTSEEERAPVYALLPTGVRANRVFVVGTLTETEDVGDEGAYWRGRVIDPTGTFFVYAGQYQPEAMAALRNAMPPAHVAVVGKPRTYETDAGEVNVSIRPERIVTVGEAVRRRWIVETAEHTLARLRAFADGDGDDVVRARNAYGDDVQAYREAVVRALEGLETDEPGAEATNV
ncbi:MAG: RPA family protein [Halobacteriales archaeon]